MAMEGRKIKASIALVLAVLAMSWAGGALAQSSDCSSVLISLSPCLNYITGNSSTPPPSCCSQLGTVVRLQPQCLCQVLNGGASTLGGININQTLALALPGACRLQTPPITRCNAASPTAETPQSPRDRQPAERGSRTVPTNREDRTSDGTSIFLSKALLSIFFIATTLLHQYYID